MFIRTCVQACLLHVLHTSICMCTRVVVVIVSVAQLCSALCDPMDCSPPGSSVHGILQARILEWVAFPSPGDLPDPGIKPRSPALQAESLPSEPPGKPIYVYTHISTWKWKWKVLSRFRLCDPMDYSVHGIFQARILEWVAFPFSRILSQLRDWTQVSRIAGRFFSSWATREAQSLPIYPLKATRS